MQWIDTASEKEFVTQTVAFLEEKILAAISERGQCVIGLSGGSTPKSIYAALGTSERIDWTKVWIFLVDDRHITPNSPDSNQYLVHTTLCSAGRVPMEQLIFPDTTLPHADCARDYGKRLASYIGKSGPADLVLLGMGSDGHIASLFPPLSEDASGPDLVIPTTTDLFAVRDRISLTIPPLESARERLFLLKGKEKSAVWNNMIKSADDVRRWPAKALLDDRTTVIYAD